MLLLGGLPGIDVVGAAADGEQALALVAEHQPDAILLDLHMPVLDGIGGHPAPGRRAPRRRRRRPHHLRRRRVGPRRPAGRRAQLPHQGRRPRRHRQALQAAAGGLSVLDARVQATLLAAATSGAPAAPSRAPEPASPALPPDGLTQREAEILALIARGLTNPEIAARLFLSNHTIKTHISRIFAKTGSRDRVAAIGYAHRHNIG